MKIMILTTFILLSVGCATTHTRVTEEKVQLKKVLVLTPQIDTKVKYIDLPKFFRNKKVQQRVEQQIVDGYADSLKEKGYKAYTEKEIYPTTLYRKYSQKIKRDLQNAGQQVIANDLEYNYDTMPEHFTPKIRDPFPEEWDKYDAVVFLYGNAKIETDKEFCVRWRGNIIYNILALPLSVTTLVFPFLVPVAFIGSGEYSFEKSPDETFLNAIVVDTYTRKVLYQHDYFISEWGFEEDEFHSIAFDSLDDFPER
ncbi:hypothetical protein [Candidatus Uabimicrobium amorphum]|uniref:Lipoprotein n=1 Tax=Uabimicrobium amorphum TaxID=2596890 RepID=A0A5S9IP95_UABAM|nr:hypothetical protein [Candidatus Uabimicrobium amorphum]BBM85106.1 hypothetical protein UABAM_03469 [Candidatus Uabimicrobium amorphum]